MWNGKKKVLYASTAEGDRFEFGKKYCEREYSLKNVSY